MTRWRTAGVVVAASALAATALAAAAPAKDGDVLVRGSCTGTTTSKLKLSDEDGRIEVEFEVDQNRNGVRWTVALRRNGRLAAKVVRFTRSPSGSFELRRLVANGPRVDVVTARATRGSAEVCTARAAFGT
jgi:hypothetical protein